MAARRSCVEDLDGVRMDFWPAAASALGRREGNPEVLSLAQWADFETAECVVQCIFILERLCGNSVAWLWEDETPLAQSPRPLLPGAISEEEAFCCRTYLCSRLRFPLSHILIQIIPQSTKNRKKRWGCFLTKLFLPFDKNIIYQPNDENIVPASKIFCSHSQMTKRQDSKKIHHTLPNAENAEIHLLKKCLKWEVIRSD